MDKLMYYRGEEITLESFYMMPKELFNDERYNSLSCPAKLLYILLFDRTRLSTANNWLDEEGRVFIYFAQEEAAKMLNISRNYANKLFKELEKALLIKNKRLGLSKPNMIYVLKATDVNESYIKKSTTITSRSNSEGNQDVTENYTNNNDNNNNDINNNEFNHILSRDNLIDGCEQSDIFNQISINVDYHSFKHTTSEMLAKELIELMCDVIITPSEYVYINGAKISHEHVKERFLKLNNYHLQSVIEILENNKREIHNIRGYMISALYNSYMTSNMAITARVGYDLYGEADDKSFSDGWGF